MENPHSERQAVLLERIIKNVVSNPFKSHIGVISLYFFKGKCVELISELNHCVEVCISFTLSHYSEDYVY